MFQIERLKQLAGGENVRENEPIANHTTFRIGGSARYYVTPETAESLTELVQYVRKEKMPYFIMGNGSNLLAKDSGYDGVLIATHGAKQTNASGTGLELLRIAGPEDRKQLIKWLPDTALDTEKTIVVAGSGLLLTSMANRLAKEGLAGFAFAGGIPGTLGGAVTMNAGAYGGEIKDCILGAMTLQPDGTQRFYTTEELELGYRTSRIQKEGLLVLWAAFAFATGDRAQIEREMRELNEKRREKQPLQYGSAGSTFKRPEGLFAGKLIQDAGLRGYRVGDVMVSEKHCGFVVNVGNGTYEQARQVISHVQETVQKQFGVQLELEVRILE